MKWPKAGIIYCDREQVACAYVSTADGSCTAARCNIHDEDYIQRQAEIEKTRQENDEKRRRQKEENKHDTPAPIRNDSNKAINQIEYLERKVKYYHKRGWKNRAFELEDELAELKRAL